MAFPVPKDVRTVRDFELVLGQDELLRQPMPINDLTKPIDCGEWVKPVTSGGVTKASKLIAGTDTLAAPALGARASWTRYRQNDASQGQADVLATGKIDILSGTYQAKTKIYDTASVLFAPGRLLVAKHDAVTDRGFLDALDPAAATVRQLQAVVGRVIEVAGGVLHYESPGL
jgi:hypothetical protein